MSQKSTATSRPPTADDNRRAVEVLLNSTALPHPAVTPLPNGVLVTVATADDLDLWLHELGGTVAVGPELAGFRLWVLTTSVSRAHGRPVPVWVACSVPLVVDVMPELAAAVTA